MRVPHQLQRLRSDGIPERMLAVDIEARRTAARGGERQTFMLACLQPVRVPLGRPVEVGPLVDIDTPTDLWELVRGYARARHRVVVWCHNLAYDLRVSGALEQLPALGLELDGIALSRTAAWASFRGDRRTVLCCDLASWLPAPLHKLADDLGMPRAPLPAAAGDVDGWRERCRADTRVTAAAVAELAELVRDQQLGPWRPTGAGQSHSAWRRRFLDRPPFVHASEQALEAERRAMWTGRCEAWQHGRLHPGGWVEYDLQLAYCNIAAECELPVRLVGATMPRTAAALRKLCDRYSVLAEVNVTTGQPLVPAANGDLIHWPVGTFDTVLWDPELQLLFEAGAAVRPARVWLYSRGAPLQSFARWLLSRLAGESEGATALQRRALKHWARTAIGRCAMRYRSWEHFADTPELDLRLGELHDLQTGETVELLHVGGRMMTLGELVDADDSTPQITGWVMAEARRRLWQLLQLAGSDTVAYMDTDSLIVDAQGADRLDRAIEAGRAWSLARKQSIRRLEVLGPRQLIVGRQRRLAGVPLSAVQTGEHEYAGQHWQGLAESLHRRDGAAVVLTEQTWRLGAVDTRRHHHADGSTSPHAVG